jgi:hypothetical protein
MKARRRLRDPMRLLMLGAPGPYPERLQTFRDAGHHLWWISTLLLPPTGPVAGVNACHLWDLARAPEEAIERLVELIDTERIDAVYSLLNVWDGSHHPTALLLRRGCPVPVIRHYKEHYLSPSADERTCLEQSDGVIFINRESRDYFATCYQLPARTACFDADLLPHRYLAGTLQPRLSAQDGHPHLLIAGTATDDGGRYDYRELIRELTGHAAHIHLYGQFRRMDASGRYQAALDVEATYRALTVTGYLHLHALVPPARFVDEWSRYDAGLLHVPRPDDPFRRLNMPNRYSAYLAAGVPVALPAGHMPAMQRPLEALGAAIVYADTADLVRRVPDVEAMQGALKSRASVTFEAVFPDLMNFVREVCGD